MKLDKRAHEKIQELQAVEQTLQNIMLQKQAFQIELNETSSALEEVNKTGKCVYKITGQIMISAEKQEVKKELEEKNKILGLRINALEKQEKLVKDRIEELRKDLESKMT